MDWCNDCKLNLCNDCYESDCDCNLAGHTLAAATLLYDAVALAKDASDEPNLDFSADSPRTDPVEGLGKSTFHLTINGRVYNVTVRAATQGGED